MEMKMKKLIGAGVAGVLALSMVIDYSVHTEKELTSRAKTMVEQELGGDIAFRSIQYKEKEEFNPDTEINEEVEAIVSGYVDELFWWVYYNEDGEAVARAIFDTDDFDYDDDGTMDYEEEYTITIE